MASTGATHIRITGPAAQAIGECDRLRCELKRMPRQPRWVGLRARALRAFRKT